MTRGMITLMTGASIKRLRRRIGVDQFALAAVLGVHVSTVYRWETTTKRLSLDPLQGHLLDAIAKFPIKRTKVLRKAIVAGLMEGGPLFALHRVLHAVLPYSEKK